MNTRATRIAIALSCLASLGAGAWAVDDVRQSKPDSEQRSVAEPKSELPANPKADAKRLEGAGPKAKVKHTPHYSIVHDTDDKTLAAFVTRIEATYKAVVRFSGQIGVPVREPKEKLRIHFFHRFDGYAGFIEAIGASATQETPGVFTPALNVSAFFNFADSDVLKKFKDELEQARADGIAARRSGARPDFSRINAYKARVAKYEERVNRIIVQHEVAHQVLFNIGVHNRRFQANPPWLVEGLAMMFETPPSASGSGLGSINQNRLVRWRDLAEEKQLPPFRDILTKPELFYPSAPEAEKAYAQAWAMVHYLQRTRRPKFVHYMQLIRERKKDTEYSAKHELATFERAFGPLDDDFIEAWEKYMKKLPMKRSAAGI